VRLYHSIPLLRIVPDDTKFDFMRFRRISFPISAALSIVAILLFFFHGLNFGIDFVGGTLIEVQSKSGAADLAKMRAALSGLGLGDVQLQEFGGPTDVLIRVAQQPGGEQAQQAAINKVREALGSEVDYRRVEVVGPRVSSELLAKSTIGLGLAIFAILIYLWFRFEWQFSLGAMIANVHDLVLTIGYMSLTQIDFDLSSIAALLTILGYSLNDTVVIYDRIREMLRRYKRMSMPDLLNISVNSTLSRSIITHVTVTLALLALLFFGGHAIHSFVATMIFGVVLVGTYTSVFIAAPILIYLWFRFEWQFALGAMIANVHDLVLTIGYMSLMQIDFDLSSIAALLTILGYSLNDTVVIYDRIREMLRRYKRMSTPELLNISVNSTLSRSIITHLTVTLALLALLLFGGHAIHSFIATMIFGVVRERIDLRPAFGIENSRSQRHETGRDAIGVRVERGEACHRLIVEIEPTRLDQRLEPLRR